MNITEATSTGIPVFQVNVKDPDEGNNVKTMFVLLSDQFISFNNLSIHGVYARILDSVLS